MRAGTKIGDRVKLMRVPPAVRRCWSKFPDTFHIFQLAVGKAFTVRGVDKQGHIELWVCANGSEDQSGTAHSIWVEPEHLS